MPSISSKWKLGKFASRRLDVAARRVDLNRHGDGVPVILDQYNTGNLRIEAVLSDSQNSPCDVVPSPTET